MYIVPESSRAAMLQVNPGALNRIAAQHGAPDRTRHPLWFRR